MLHANLGARMKSLADLLSTFHGYEDKNYVEILFCFLFFPSESTGFEKCY